MFANLNSVESFVASVSALLASFVLMSAAAGPVLSA